METKPVVPDPNIKTVSVQVPAEVLKSMSRTRRRRRTQKGGETQVTTPTMINELPVANSIQIEKKPERPTTPVAPVPIVEQTLTTPVKIPIQLGRKRTTTRKSSATTAAAPGTPGARASGTLAPKIIYSKKRTLDSTLRSQMSPGKLRPKTVFRTKPRTTRRTFRERQIAVTVGGAAKPAGLTVRYNSPEKMRAELTRAGILRAKSRIPDDKLTRLYNDFQDLKAGGL